MTDLAEAKELVHARFLAEYTGVTLDRITFENEKFTEPEDGEWVRLTVRSTSRVQSTLGKSGNRRFRSTASALVQVFTQVNEGVRSGSVLAKEAADVFEGKSFSGLDFRSAVVREAGIDGGWFQSVAEAQFDYDEIK